MQQEQPDPAVNAVSTMTCTAKSPEYNSRKPGLMTLAEMGEILGIRRTEQYAIIRKGLFETVTFQGKTWVVRESFEIWLRSQVRFRRYTEGTGSCLAGAMSVKDIAEKLGKSTATVHRIIKDNELDTVFRGNRQFVLRESFESWLEGQDRYIIRTASENIPDEPAARPAKKHNPAYLTVQAAAGLAGVSTVAVFAWIRDGKVPAKRCGRHTYLPFTEFTQWLDHRARGE